MITIQGKGVSAGVGVGPLYFYRRATAEIKRYTVEDTDAEWHRFKGAQTGAVEQLGVLAEQARKEAGDEAAMLFETHQMMAEDLDYEEAIRYCSAPTTWPPPRRSSWISRRFWASSRQAAPAPAIRPFWPAPWASLPSLAWATP